MVFFSQFGVRVRRPYPRGCRHHLARNQTTPRHPDQYQNHHAHRDVGKHRNRIKRLRESLRGLAGDRPATRTALSLWVFNLIKVTLALIVRA